MGVSIGLGVVLVRFRAIPRKSRLRSTGVGEQWVPSIYLIAAVPIARRSRGAEGNERAVRISGAGIAEVVVEIGVLPAPAKPVQVPAKLLVPQIYEVLGIDFDRLDLADHGLGYDDSSNHSSVARNSEMLEGPTIAQKLAPQIPFFCPIRFQTLSSLLISDDGPAIAFAEKIESTSVDKGITADRMSGEAWKVKWDGKRIFKCRRISGEIRLNTIRSRRIDSHIVLDRCPHVFRSLWMAFFSDNKVSPFSHEGSVGPCQGRRSIKTIEVYLLAEALKCFTEHRARMEIDGGLGWP